MTHSFPPSRRKLLLLLAVAVLIVGAGWFARPPREPLHRGQRLSEIIFAEDFWRGQGITNFRSSQQRLAGLNAAGVRWLAYQVEHGRRPSPQKGERPFTHAPGWLRKWVPERWGGLRAPIGPGDARIRAGDALRLIGAAAAPAIPALVRGLHDEDAQQRELAARTLNGIGLVSWPVERDLLEHADSRVRLALLGEMSVRANRGEAVSAEEMALVAGALIQLCRDPSPDIRRAAVAAIHWCRYYEPDAAFDAAIPDLIRLLSDPDSEVRHSAGIALTWYEKKGAPAIPRLIELLDDPDTNIRTMAAGALGLIDIEGQRSLPRLRAMTQDPDPKCVHAATTALKAFASASKSADAEAKPEASH